MFSPINDGYTLTGKIDARGPWPEIVIRYRLALEEDIADYQAKYRAATPKNGAQLQAGFLARFLQSWNVTDKDGTETKPTPANVAKLPRPYQVTIMDYVCGYAVDQQEEDAKNSGSGSC